MNRDELIEQIRLKQSFLCVGLDSDISKIPQHLLKEVDPILAFNKSIIDATKDYCVAYKPNLAFYESLGPNGWITLQKTLEYIPQNIFTIADAKRGDIGNTAKMYAKTFFEIYNFDAVTVAPYMGIDSVAPFLEFEDKWTILLGLTSNEGSNDFQRLKAGNDSLFEHVIKRSQEWGNPSNLMYVIGATHGQDMKHIRELAASHFFLVPGVGAQGGDLDAVAKHGMNDDIGLLVNSSRDIIYADSSIHFEEKVAQKAKALQSQMATYL